MALKGASILVLFLSCFILKRRWKKKIEEDVIYCDVRVSFLPRRLKTLRSEEQKAWETFHKDPIYQESLRYKF